MQSGRPGWRIFFMDIVLGLLTFLGLYAARLYSYLLFHCLAELFSVVIACSIFVIAWNTRKIADNHYFLFIGIAYLFVGVVDLFHTLAYRGMGVFGGYTANLPTQLWIAARYLESVSLLAAPLFFHRKLKVYTVFAAYSLAVGLLILGIFVFRSFPDCFVDGVGLTFFKVASEYVICAILVAAIAVLLKSRDCLDVYVVKLLSASMVVTVLSEMSFTLYRDVYGLFNMLGHYMKVVSFYLIYKAVIEKGLTQPYTTIFRELKRSETLLQQSREEQRIIFDSDPSWIYYKNRENQFVRVNQSFADVMGMPKDRLEGRSLFDIYAREEAEASWRDDKEVVESGEPKLNIIESIETSKGRLWVQVNKVPYRDTQGQIEGIIGFAVDITERRRAETEKEKLIEELQKALSEVKTLSGLLPICSSCKKIRNDEGYWEQIEGYIKDRSDADFSHGICPDCAKRMYPEIFDKK
jgi:PAS domain S-box-containing protein